MIDLTQTELEILQRKHPAAFEAGYQLIDALVEAIVSRTGYFMLHSVNGSYCCHWNPEDEQSGCRESSVRAVLDHVAKHVRQDGAEVCP